MTIKLRALVRPPARIEGDTGIAVESANGVVTVALDLAALPSTASIADPATTTVPLVTPGLTAEAPDLVERIAVSELLALATNFDAELAAIAGLASAADKLPYFTGAGTAALADLSAFGRTLVDDASAAAALTTLGVSPFAQTLIDDISASAARATLGLVIGADVQAHDAELAAIASLASAANKVPYFTGPGTAALTDLSAFARTMLDDADAAAVRATIGVGLGTGDLVAANNLSDVSNAATAFGNIKQAATTGATGVVELATNAEFIAATDMSRVITPGNLAARPCVSAHKDGSDQGGVTEATYTKVTFETEVFDIGGYYASSTWTPPAGKYRISCSIYFTTANAVAAEVLGAVLYKNGSEHKSAYFGRSGTTAASVQLTCLVEANGTDTFEIYAYGGSVAAKTIGGNAAYSYFMGEKL